MNCRTCGKTLADLSAACAKCGAKPEATIGGAAGGDDPFASLPDAPSFHAATADDSTGAIIRRTSEATARSARRRNVMIVVLVVGTAAILAAGLGGGAVQVRGRATPGEERDNVDWSKLKDDPAFAARLRAAQPEAPDEEEEGSDEPRHKRRRRRGDGEDKAAVDPRAAARRDEVVDELTPEQMALLLNARADKPRAGGPTPKLVDDAIDINSAGAGGGIDEKQVAQKINGAQTGFASCISTALRRDPRLKLGKVVMTATVAPSGFVPKVRFAPAAVGDTAVGECLAKVVKGIPFSAFDGAAAEVQIPLTIGASE